MKDFFTLLRPAHWIKNVFVFAAIIFGRKLLGPPQEVILTFASAAAGFICFCLASSAVYIFNDIIDRKADRNHPQKSTRPIAAGKTSIVHAATLSIICAAISTIASFSLNPQFSFIIVIYLILNILYSLKLKHAIILDVIIIATGFVLRAIAGAVIIGVDISPWLIICTFTLCLFIGFSKRFSELKVLESKASSFRDNLAEYTPALLAHMMNVTSTLSIATFLLYAMDRHTTELFGQYYLVYTSPLVFYCVFRFSALIQKGRYTDPVELITKDRPFQISLMLWAIACSSIVYFDKFNFLTR